MNKIIEWFGHAIKWLYQKSKAGLIKIYNWLVVKLPILKDFLKQYFNLALKLLKGSLYGMFYGMKDGYHAYRIKYNKEQHGEYFFLTTVEFNTDTDIDEEEVGEQNVV